MKTFERGEEVVVAQGDDWVRGFYLDASGGDHGVLVHVGGFTKTAYVGDDKIIRPLPSFVATGDDLRLTAEALAHYAHERVRLDMEHNGGLTDDTLAVQRLHERAKRAMEVAG